VEFKRSKELQRRIHDVIPGGCHTYAKGDDQFPLLSPGFIARGQGSHVWDVDGNEFIEYGMGCRAVTLGHAYRPVVEAAQQELQRGLNFARPAPIELECAEELLGMIDGAEMAKFAKDGSAVTTAALKLARAHTGRDLIAFCSDHPFFATNDWFIGSTVMDAGIPQAHKELSLTFRYNDLESVQKLFKQHPGRIAGLIMEPAKYEDPQDDFLHKVKELCHADGTVFILDEMITGFRWHNGGAQKYYDIMPDLSAFGKALANGFSLSALVGKREIMKLGGLLHDKPRAFLLSTTHGAETHSLAAAIATMRIYQSEPVVETLDRQGARLAGGINHAIESNQLAGHVGLHGKPCCLVFSTRDQDQKPSQAFRTLLMQELIRNGVLGTSLIVSYSHTDEDIDHTIRAFDAALQVYRQALSDGVERYLIGPPTQSVYRRHNDFALERHPANSPPAAVPTEFTPVSPTGSCS
jgi:glutamate-1-semialdehyde 2,1-aminomutase